METNISILKSHLTGHPPPAIEYDVRKKIKNLEEDIDSSTEDIKLLRKQRDKLKSEKIKRFVQAAEANNTPMRKD